ncbi:MAG TPA: ROK family protein [Vicinamibacterales bacterium]|jgi:predicted NBD/HSP70 family sugar kinase
MATPDILGLELSDSIARAIVVDADGRVAGRAEGPSSEAGALAEAASTALRAAGTDRPRLIGVAAIEPLNVRVQSVIKTLSTNWDTQIRSEFVGWGGAYALAESWCGAARGARNILAFAVGERSSAGIILDGRLWTGAHGLAGSAAWLALNPVEREDYRKLGCLDAEVGATGIVRRFVWRIKSGDQSRVVDMVDGNLAAITLPQILAGARDGDGVAISVVRDTVKYIGMAVSNLATTVDPEVIVLGGMVQTAGDLLLDPLRYECGRRMSPAMYNSIKIELATLGADAPAIGAARQALTGFS